MAIVAPTTVADRFRHELVNCHPTIDGDVTLTPTNLYNNWHFQVKNLSGDPEGIVIGMPESPDGYMIYMSDVTTPVGVTPKKVSGASTLAAQNTEPVDVADPSYTIAGQYVGGDFPKTGSTTANIAPPALTDADVSVISVAKTGWQAADYYVSYTWMKGKKHTTMAPFVQVTMLQGQFMVVTIPDSPADGATGMGIWVSAPGKGPETARLQKIVRLKHVIPPSVTLKGPWFKRDKSPNRNQTERDKPKKPVIVRRKGRRRGKAGTFEVSTAFVDAFGNESERSEWSDPIVLTEADALKGHHVGVDFAETLAEGDDFPGADAVRIYIRYNGKEYVLYKRSKKGSGSTDRHTSLEDILFSGRTTPEAEDGEDQVLDEGRRRRKPRDKSAGGGGSSGGRGSARDASVSSGSSSSSQGLDNPTSPLDNVSGINAPRLLPGDYLVAISYWVRDRETAISTPVKVTVPSTGGFYAIKIALPSSVNLLHNAQFTRVDADGVPDGWNLTNANATTLQGLVSATDETLLVSTNGSKTTTGLTPTVRSAPISIDRDSTYIVGGGIQTNLSAGVAQVYLDELRDDGLLTHSTRLRTDVVGISSVLFQKTFGPSPGINFQNDAVSVQLRFQFADASGIANSGDRSGAFNLTDLYVFDHPTRLRRIETSDDPREPDNADPSGSIPWPAWSYKAVGLPPSFNRTPPELKPIEVADFSSGNILPTGSTGWSFQRTSTTGMTMEATSTAAIDNTPGLHLQKNVSTTQYGYIFKDFGARANLAARAKYRIRAIPTGGGHGVDIMQIKNASADGFTTGTVASLRLVYPGTLRCYYHYVAGGHIKTDYRDITTGIRTASGTFTGDILDLEIIVGGAGTTNATISIGVGKNGATRSYTNIAGLDLRGWSARVVQLGFSYWTNTSDLANIDVDAITITETGAPLTDIKPPSVLEALTLPDRPSVDPTYLEQYDFEGSTVIPAAFTSVRDVTTGTTLAVQASSNIVGTNGLRVSDAQSTSTANIYLSRALPTTHTSLGFRTRFRLVTRPTTGTVRLMSALNDGGQVLAYLYMDGNGNLYLQPQPTTGTPPSPTQIAANLPSGSVVTAEMVFHDVGLATGWVTAWISIGGTGGITERQQMTQPIGVDWTGSPLRTLRFGLFSELVAGVQATLDYDEIAITEAGEVLFDEATEAATPINQVYVYYVPGTPQRDDLGPRGLVRAVKPGATYVAFAKMRYAEVEGQCWPFTVTAFDIDDNPIDLGSVVGDAGIGADTATGPTAGWALYTLQFVVPKAGAVAPDGTIYEKDCYEVQVSSPGISSGEFVFQKVGVSPGFAPVFEVAYPTSGQVVVTLDTLSPDLPPHLDVLRNEWLDLGTIVEVPDGCSATLSYGSTETLVQPSLFFSAEADVPRARYVHFKVVITSDSTGRLTPALRQGSPWVDYATYFHATQTPALLKGDLTEFPGGAFVPDFVTPTFRPQHDIVDVKGHTVRHPRTEKIRMTDPATVNVYTEETRLEIVNAALEGGFDYVVEHDGYRYVLKLTDDVDWEVNQSNKRKDANGLTYLEATIKLPACEVIEMMSMPKGVL